MAELLRQKEPEERSSIGQEWVPRSAVVALLVSVMLTAALLLYCT